MRAAIRVRRRVLLGVVLLGAAPLLPSSARAQNPEAGCGNPQEVVARIAQGDRQVADFLRGVCAGLENLPTLLTLLGVGSGADAATTPATLGVISRPSLGNAVDSALDVNNNEGTLTLTIAPVLLVDPWADYRYANTKLTVSSNTEQSNFTAGLRWDWTQRDPRFYFQHVAPAVDVGAEVAEAVAACTGIADIDQRLACRDNALNRVVDRHLEQAREGSLGVSLGGNVTYDNNGSYDGSKATLAAEWVFHPGDRWSLPLVANARWEDERAVDAPPTAERDQQVGGGLELSANRSIGDPAAPKRVGLGFGAAVLGCVDEPCTNDDATVRLNPFVSFGLTESIAGRVDLVWEGDGSDIRSAVAGIKFDYAFSGLGD